MKKFIVAVSMAVLLAAPVFVFADHTTAHAIEQLRVKIAELQAQISTLRQSSVGVGTAILPQSVQAPVPSILPGGIFDDDSSDDDIVQLNNLRIQTVSGSDFPAVISAYHDFGVRCLKFQSQESRSGAEIACPVPRSVLYQIRVDQETRLLLRNRLRAKISDFETGDRINAYGFMDRDTNAIDAIIVRNLDKPPVRQFLQLNNVEVSSAPSSSALPATFTVVERNRFPCFDFGESGRGRGSPFPCPLGEDAQVLPGIAGKSAEGSVVAPNFYPPQRKYEVRVSSATKILDRSRQPINLGAIEVGDILNVYGMYSPISAGVIDAVTIRDLSKPRITAGILRVVVARADISCVQGLEKNQIAQNTLFPFECGSLYNALVSIERSGVAIAKSTTEKGFAVFENLEAGNYVVRASAPGFQEGKSEVAIYIGGKQSLTIALEKKEEPQTNRPPVIHGVSGPVILKVGETGTWSVKAYDPEQKPLRYSVVWGDEMTDSPTATVSPTVYIQTATFTHSYAKAGIYNPTFTVTDSAGLSAKTSVSVKVGDTVVSSIFSASPTSGSAPLAVMFYSNTQSGTVNFGDGTPSTSMECDTISATNSSSVSSACLRTFTRHTYTAPGIYTATLQALPQCAVYVGQTDSSNCKPVTIGNVTITVTGGTAQPLTVISPNGGEQWQKGTTQNIKWTAPSSVSSVSISLEQWYACLYTFPSCEIAVRPYTVVTSTQNDGVFEWGVGKDASGFDIPAGQYIVTVSGGEFSDVSDKPFSIAASGTIVVPTISSLQPTSGPVGTSVTIVGSGFTTTNNSVNFGGDYLDGINSNGTTITFTIPDTITPCPRISEIVCIQLAKQVTPGTYAISVTNANGASNTVNFTVTSKTGTLSINPTSAGIKVGGATEFQALFDNCPSGAQCFVGPLPVRAVWASSNPKVASVAYKEIPCPAGSSCFVQQFDYLTAVVTGISLGSATITATYTDSSGAVFTANAVVTTVMP